MKFWFMLRFSVIVENIEKGISEILECIQEWTQVKFVEGNL